MSVHGIDGFALWLLPGLFLLHDLEETCGLPPWLQRHRGLLTARFPRLAVRFLPHAVRIGRRSFALIAGEELLILTGVTAYAAISEHYAPWLALYLAFTLHLGVHICQALALRRIFPALITSVCCLPVCLWMLRRIVDRFPTTELVACATAGIAAATLNLWLLHRLAGRLHARRMRRRPTGCGTGSPRYRP